MKNTFIVISLLALAACSSTPKTGDGPTDAILAHLSKGKTVVGKDWDSRFLKDGLVNGEYTAIGKVASDINRNETSLKSLAQSKAVDTLLMSAPTDYKRIIQSALSSSDNSDGSVEEVTISIKEVKALTGMKTEFGDFQCVTYAEPNNELKYDMKKECRAIVRIPASHLAEAYQFTLKNKYGIEQNSLQSKVRENILEALSGASGGSRSVAQTPKTKAPVGKAYDKE